MCLVRLQRLEKVWERLKHTSFFCESWNGYANEDTFCAPKCYLDLISGYWLVISVV